MRHILANVFLYALVSGLLLGAMGFAWVRSEQLVIAHEVDLEPRKVTDAVQPTESEWLEFGERTYRVNCQNCHTPDGSGRGMYPPIQRMTAHLDAAGGRTYLVNLALYGVYTGTYGAPMPPMPELSDAEIAAVTNYMLVQFAADGEGPNASEFYQPREVAALRGQDFSEWDIASQRPAIASAKELGRGVRPPSSTGASGVPGGKEE